MRGARGIEFGVDLPAIPAIGLGGVSSLASRTAAGDGWGFGDWGRLVGAWKKEETMEKEVVANAETSGSHKPVPTKSSPQERAQERARRRESDDAVVKSSTDKLSAVFDWLIEQVPAPPRLGAKEKVMEDVKKRTKQEVVEIRQDRRSPEVSEMQKHMNKEGQGRRVNELASKQDLERFYIALSRKLYDEGL